MKIAVVTVATNTIPRFRIDMIDEFTRRGCEVVVLGDEPECDWADYFAEHGCWYRRFSVSRNGLNPLADVRTMRQLNAIMRRERPDKVFTYQAKGNIYGVPAAKKAANAEAYAMMGGLGSVFNGEGVKSKAVSQLVVRQYRRAFANIDRVFFQNVEDVARFENLGIVDRSKVVMVHGSGVNLGQFPEKPLPQGISFLFVGRLVRGKGILEFLEAARMVKEEHPEVRFDVVGPFDTNPTSISEAELESYVADGIVSYHGLQGNTQPFYERCTAFVLPSYYGEGTPKSALEAMATGRPVIAADAVGCREVVRAGENGFLVPRKDARVVAATMNALIEDGALCERMARASRRMAEELFDVRKVNDTICSAMRIDISGSRAF